MIDNLACENSCFFLLLAPWDILPGETFVLQRQKYLTDNVNQCLHQSLIWESWKLFDFMFHLVNFGKGLCSSAVL